MEEKKTVLSSEQGVENAERQALAANTAPSIQGPEEAYLPFTSIKVPEPINGMINQAGEKFQSARMAALVATPAFVVNRASNFIGATQLVGEVLYYKSSGRPFYDNGVVPKDPVQKVLQPIKNMYYGTAKGLWDDIRHPSSLWEGVKSFHDLDAATLRDSKGHTKKLSNNLSARSGLSGMTAMLVATVLPDHDETEEEKEYYTNLAKNNPGGYAAKRLGEALWVPGWGEHKRQFSGLGMISAGVFSAISGFRQVQAMTDKVYDGVRVTKNFNPALAAKGLPQFRYMTNHWQTLGGVITTFAGLQLMMAVDNQQAWTNYGKTQFTRLITLPSSIGLRFAKTEQGAVSYFLAQATFQTKNLVAAMLGGAEKLPDGTVVDLLKEGAPKKGDTQKRIDESASPKNKVSDVVAQSRVKDAPEKEAVMASA